MAGECMGMGQRLVWQQLLFHLAGQQPARSMSGSSKVQRRLAFNYGYYPDLRGKPRRQLLPGV